jgi:anti-sigma regulatory factor (Ser/Thr protein kinase)
MAHSLVFNACLRLHVPPDAGYARDARELIHTFATERGMSEDDVHEFVTAVSEALANAMEHGRPREPIDVLCSVTSRGDLIARVCDRGVGFSPDDASSDGRGSVSYRERGRGLTIMRGFSDHLTIKGQPGKGTVVTFLRAGERYERVSKTKSVVD